MKRRILLLEPPFFTPWTPPLGLGLLKAFLQARGHEVRCVDLNASPEVWGLHRRYFERLRPAAGRPVAEGHTVLWWVLNAHQLALLSGQPPARVAEAVQAVAEHHRIRLGSQRLAELGELLVTLHAGLRASLRALSPGDYDMVGTSTYTTSLGPSLLLLRELRERWPGVRTVMGGGVFADDLALGADNLDVLLERHPYVDHVVLGEGELALAALVEGELEGQRLISRESLPGRALSMVDAPLPDFDDFDIDRYFHLTIEGARSCPFQCAFCSETVQWGGYRKKPARLLADQMEALAERHGLRSFFMGDSLMNPYIDALSTELLSRPLGLVYDGYLRADRPVTDPERVERWARSGLRRARMGIESASPSVLQRMDKRTTPEGIAAALRTLASRGIRTTTYWIVGFPDETDEEHEQTLEFIRREHRSIYELEAHPYYYYPYGQVSSRRHEAVPVHAPSINEVLGFREWAIRDGRPSHEERYDRLDRITRLASELGIPNIYSMQQRYQAEERWLRLHPLAERILPAPDDRPPVRARLRDDDGIAVREARRLAWVVRPTEPLALETLQQASDSAFGAGTVRVRVLDATADALGTALRPGVRGPAVLVLGHDDPRELWVVDEERGVVDAIERLCWAWMRCLAGRRPDAPPPSAATPAVDLAGWLADRAEHPPAWGSTLAPVEGALAVRVERARVVELARRWADAHGGTLETLLQRAVATAAQRVPSTTIGPPTLDPWIPDAARPWLGSSSWAPLGVVPWVPRPAHGVTVTVVPQPGGLELLVVDDGSEPATMEGQALADQLPATLEALVSRQESHVRHHGAALARLETTSFAFSEAPALGPSAPTPAAPARDERS